MPAPNPLRQYQQQSVRSATPAELVDKLYGIGVTAARAGDEARTRRVLVELAGALDYERGGEIAASLSDLYDYGIRATSTGDLDVVADILNGLRDAWRQSALAPSPAPAEV